MDFKFPVINPLFHNELRLKIMVALDNLKSADFVYLCQITESTRGNLSVQLTTLKDAGYIEITKTGMGRLSHTVCRITRQGHEALSIYEEGLRFLFNQQIPSQKENQQNKQIG